VVLSRTGVDVMSKQYFTRPNVQPVITYIGTTPEQRQMSTEEFKAKFDEMTVNLQNYIKETLLTELDAFKQEFMTHLAESAHSLIKLIINCDIFSPQQVYLMIAETMLGKTQPAYISIILAVTDLRGATRLRRPC